MGLRTVSSALGRGSACGRGSSRGPVSLEVCSLVGVGGDQGPGQLHIRGKRGVAWGGAERD